jgi:hypothetical protein
MQMKKPHRFAGATVMGSDKEKTRREAIGAELNAGLWPICAHGPDPSTRASHEETVHARKRSRQPFSHDPGNDEPFVGRICERTDGGNAAACRVYFAQGQQELPM